MKLYINNVIDVITNSSSELFIINNPNNVPVEKIVNMCIAKLDEKYDEKYKSFIKTEWYDPSNYCCHYTSPFHNELFPEEYIGVEFEEYCWVRGLAQTEKGVMADTITTKGDELTYVELYSSLHDHIKTTVFSEIERKYAEIAKKGLGVSKEEVVSMIPSEFSSIIQPRLWDMTETEANDFLDAYDYLETFKASHLGYELRSVLLCENPDRRWYVAFNIPYESDGKIPEDIPECLRAYISQFRADAGTSRLEVPYTQNSYFSTILNEWEYGYERF